LITNVPEPLSWEVTKKFVPEPALLLIVVVVEASAKIWPVI
jgi:hypothetical protein